MGEMIKPRSDNILVYGRHVMGELYGCNPQKLMDAQFLTNLIKEAAIRGNMTLLDIKAWKINPGVSIVGIVLESHISIHTWPEYEFATVDVYSCGSHTNPEKAFDYIVEALEAKKVIKRYSERNFILEEKQS